MYSLRLVSASEVDALYDIWSLAFGFYAVQPEESETSRESTLEYVKESCSFIVGAYDGPRLVATAAVIDFDLKLGDRFVPCGGVAGVATAPEHRRRGTVQLLITDCLKRLYEREVPVSALWPFSYPFYERMGWSVTDHHYSVECDLKHLHKRGDSRNYRMVALDDFSQAMPVHERWIEKSNLSMRRKPHRWKRMLNHPLVKCKMFVHDDGYMVWNLKDQKDTLAVREWAYCNEAAFADGLELMGQMDSQFDKAVWDCPDVEAFLQLGILDPQATIKINPGMMSRVVHPKAFYECIGGGGSKPIIRDPMGVSGKSDGDGIHPGALMQLVTGYWSQPPRGMPADLQGIAASKRAYSAEKY